MSRAGTGVRGDAAAGGGAGGRGSQAARHPQPTQLLLLLFPGTVSFRSQLVREFSKFEIMYPKITPVM
jgi:hypothetical protein